MMVPKDSLKEPIHSAKVELKSPAEVDESHLERNATDVGRASFRESLASEHRP